MLTPCSAPHHPAPALLGDVPVLGGRVIYLLWSDGDLLYVGQTGDLHQRLRAHANTKPWWLTVTHIEVHSGYASWLSVSRAECALIDRLEPLHNRPYAPSQRRMLIGANR